MVSLWNRSIVHQVVEVHAERATASERATENADRELVAEAVFRRRRSVLQRDCHLVERADHGLTIPEATDESRHRIHYGRARGR